MYIIINLENKEPQSVVTMKVIVLQPYLYWLAEVWLFLYIIIVNTIISIKEMIVRPTFAINDKIKNCKSNSSSIPHHLAFLCRMRW